MADKSKETAKPEEPKPCPTPTLCNGCSVVKTCQAPNKGGK